MPRNSAPSSTVKTHFVSNVPSGFGRASRTPLKPPSRSTTRAPLACTDCGRLSAARCPKRRQVRDHFVNLLLRRHPGFSGLLVDDEGARGLVLFLLGLRSERRAAGRQDDENRCGSQSAQQDAQPSTCVVRNARGGLLRSPRSRSAHVQSPLVIVVCERDGARRLEHACLEATAWV